MNAGIQHAENAALCTVSRPSSYCVTQQHAERREGKGGKARRGSAPLLLRNCVSRSFWILSAPHGAIMPQYVCKLMKSLVIAQIWISHGSDCGHQYLWVEMPCCLVDFYQHIGGTCHFHHLPLRWRIIMMSLLRRQQSPLVNAICSVTFF
jgi:hypothetical protein